MNTLNRTITSQFFKTEKGYNEFVARWKTLFSFDENDPSPYKKKGSYLLARPELYLFYSIVRGKDYRKAFGVPKKPNKIYLSYRNGKYSYSLFESIGAIKQINWVSSWTKQKTSFGKAVEDLFGDLIDIEKVSEFVTSIQSSLSRTTCHLEQEAYPNV